MDGVLYPAAAYWDVYYRPDLVQQALRIPGGSAGNQSASRRVGRTGTEGNRCGPETALSVDGAGNLYVADIGNSRVQKYTPGP